MAMKGYIYRGLKPVHWSPSSVTALAEAELEVILILVIKRKKYFNLSYSKLCACISFSSSHWIVPEKSFIF